jgi:DNA-binding Xre family transcriptional regulator
MDTVLTTPFKSPLDKWLWANRKTARWLAEKIGVHEATVSRIRNKDYSQASDELLTQIREVTGLKKL